ncbi:MAG: NUDIX domain-containing protein [Patescibacteria group bacterium]|mgnify:CR=1 FL=1
MPDLDPRLHFVAVTAIIVKDGKFLITKRSPTEKAFPNKWTVPGGKFVLTEYQHLPRTSSTHPQWYNVVEYVLNKEVKEEVGLEIEKPQYLTDLVFVRPDGYPVATLSFWARYKGGEVVLSKDLTNYAWVTAEEAVGYDLIEGIREEIGDVSSILNGRQGN